MKGEGRDFQNLHRKWACELEKLGKSWMGEIEAEVSRYIGDLSKTLFNPEMIMEFKKRSGIDLTGMSGSVSGETDFDPYRIMGLDKTASDEEVKTRYRQLLRKLHPDTSEVEGTDTLFLLVTAAYEAIKKERGW